MTVGQGRECGHLKSFCVAGPSIFHPEIARTDRQRTDGQGNSCDQLKLNRLNLWKMIGGCSVWHVTHLKH